MTDLAAAPEAIEAQEAARASRRHFVARASIYGLLGFFSIFYIGPLLIVVLNSFRPLREIVADGFIALPRGFHWDAWLQAWNQYCIGGICEGVQPYFWNSVLITIPATILSTALGAINGYVLSKWRFRGSELVFGCVLLGVFMPSQLALLPWAYTLGVFGLSNSIYGLILVHCVQGLSFTALFCRNYYNGIPDDIIKAARIDGAGFWRIFYRVVLPLSPPILVVTVIWQFTGIWNEYLFGVVLNAGDKKPITAALSAIGQAGQNVTDYDVASAAVLIGALPPLLIYFFAGKYFVRGLAQGAIK